MDEGVGHVEAGAESPVQGSSATRGGEVQRTEAWYEARRHILTASDFGAACGLSPYKTRQALWREKKGRARPVEVSPAMQWGIDHEADALLAFAMETGELPVASGLVIHPEYSWLGCSPDADTGTVLIECKCPYNGHVHRDIPEHYMAQIQGQLEIVGRERCAFVSWTPDETNIIWVERSQEYWAQMFSELQSFWRFVVDDVEPPRRRKGK